MNEIELAFTGDIMFGGFFSGSEPSDYSAPFDEITRQFETVDILCVDLETPLCLECSPVDKNGPVLHSPPEAVAGLRALGSDVVGLNNNHVTDCGDAGVRATIETLKSSRIEHFGIGTTEPEAAEPAVLEQNGVDCAIVGYTTDSENVEARIACDGQFGGAQYDTEIICAQVSKLQTSHSLVVVVFHWGHENHWYPAPDQIEKARAVAEAGADIIVGHHPHVIQGYEDHDGTPIFYSLGNFFFPEFKSPDGLRHRWHDENRVSLVPRVTVRDGTVTDVSTTFVEQRDETLKVVSQDAVPVEFETLCNRIERSEAYKSFWEGHSSNRQRTMRRRHLRRRVGELGLAGVIRRVNRDRMSRYSRVLLRSVRDRLRY